MPETFLMIFFPVIICIVLFSRIQFNPLSREIKLKRFLNIYVVTSQRRVSGNLRRCFHEADATNAAYLDGKKIIQIFKTNCSGTSVSFDSAPSQFFI